MKNIVELFLKTAEKEGSKTAIVDGDKTITYAQLAESVEHTASYFAKAGIKSGMRVLVFVPMSIRLYRIVLALFYIGATAVFLDEWVSFKRLRLCAKLAGCQGFVGNTKARILAFFTPELRTIKMHLSPKKQRFEPHLLQTVNLNQAALITFTTGSTGTPKAALRSHYFLAAQFKALSLEIAPQPDQIELTTLPIVLFLNLGIGGTSIISTYNQKKPSRTNFKNLADLIDKQGVNRITASPYFLAALADHLKKNKTELPKLAHIFTGGAPVFPNSAQTLNLAFPNTAIKIVYGSTEAEPISAIDATALARVQLKKIGGLPVGHIHPDITIRIGKWINKPLIFSEYDFDLASLPEGEIGEIWVKGNHVLTSYFNNKTAFARYKIPVGNDIWHRTGDSGFLRHGQLYLTGPCKELIATPNGYISPFLAENEIEMATGGATGTVLSVANKTIVVIESKTQINKNALHLPFLFDHLITVKTIPRDPRHFSKLDYEKLRLQINRLML